MAASRESVEVIQEGAHRRVTITGRVTVDDLTDVIARSVELELEQTTSTMLIDFSPVEHINLSEEELFRVVASMRRRLRPAGDYRFAVVAPTEALARFVDEFVSVRDLIAGNRVDVPPVRLFADLAEAEAWLGVAPE